MKNLIKSVFILCFITSLSTSAQAQVFKHDAGIQFDFFSFKDSYTDLTGSCNPVSLTVIPGLTYKASLLSYVSKTRHLHIILTSYPFVGLFANLIDTKKLVYEIPLLVEFFYGDIDYFVSFSGIRSCLCLLRNSRFWEC